MRGSTGVVGSMAVVGREYVCGGEMSTTARTIKSV
jgi:hypothetical protein